jgi:hypothetical protein
MGGEGWGLGGAAGANYDWPVTDIAATPSCCRVTVAAAFWDVLHYENTVLITCEYEPNGSSVNESWSGVSFSIVSSSSATWPSAALISCHSTVSTGNLPRRKPLIVPKGPACQI